jgi:CRP-like cAMP-binding protein
MTEPIKTAEWQAPPPPPLPALGILAGLTAKSLANLASYGKYVPAKPGHVVITEGELQDCFYILVSGELEISMHIQDKPVVLAKAWPGECIGEPAAFCPGPASATVKVVTPSMLWTMDADALREYLLQHPGGGGVLLLGIAACLSQRLRAANQLVRKHVPPVFALPNFAHEAVKAEDISEQTGFFARLKQHLTGEKKPVISKEIKM